MPSGTGNEINLCPNDVHDFYDDAGELSDYSPNFSGELIYRSNLGAQGVIEVTFNEFLTNMADTLYVYSINSANVSTPLDTLFGNVRGARGIVKLYSNLNDGGLRFVFSGSSGAANRGWSARVREASAKPAVDLLKISGTYINDGDSVFRVCRGTSLDLDAINVATASSVTYNNETYTYDPNLDPGVSYNWNSTDFGTHTDRTWLAQTYGTEGSYPYTLTVSYGTGGCFVFDTVFRVNVSTTPIFSGTSSSKTICEGENVQIDGNAVSTTGYNADGTTTYSYTPVLTLGTWSDLNSGGFVSNNGTTVRVPATSTPGTYCYKFTVTDDFGCQYDTTICITVSENKNAGADVVESICGDNIGVDLNALLDGTQDAGGTWHDLTSPPTGYLSPSGTFNAQNWMGSDPNPKTATFSYYLDPNPGCQADSAILTLTVYPENRAGTDKTFAVCNTETCVKIIDSLGTNQMSGTWTCDQTQPGLYNASTYCLDLTRNGGNTNPPGSVNSGIYRWTYTVDNGVCPQDQATLTIDVKRQGVAGGNATFDVCSGDPVFRLIDKLGPQPDTTPLVSVSWTFLDGGVYGGTDYRKTFDPSESVQTSNGPFHAKYTVRESTGTCPDSSAILTINYQKKPESGTEKMPVPDICTDAGTYDLFNRLDPPYSLDNGVWTDTAGVSHTGANGEIIDLSTIPFGSGVTTTIKFKYTVTSTNTVCNTSATEVTVNFTKGSYAGTNRTLNICENEDIFFVLDSVGSPLSPRTKYNSTISITGSTALAGSEVNVTFNPVGLGGTTQTITINDPSNGPACAAKTSTLTINLAKRANAGADNLAGEVCETETDFDLKTLLSGNDVDADGDDYWTVEGFPKDDPSNVTWLQSGSGIVNLSGLSFPGCNVYRFEYHSVSANCIEDTATFELDVKCSPNAGIDSDTLYVCSKDGLLTLKDYIKGSYDLTGRYVDKDGSGGVLLPGSVNSQFDPSRAPKNDFYTIEYIVDNPPCTPADTSKITIFISVSPRAGKGDTSYACQSTSTHDLYQSIGGTYDRKGYFRLEMLPPWDTTFINQEVNNNHSFYFSGTEDNMINVQRLVDSAFGKSTTPLFTNPTFPPFVRFRYTVTDTNAVPGGPLCPDSTITLILGISPAYNQPNPSQLTPVQVCESQCEFNLNTLVTGLDFKKYTADNKLVWTGTPALTAISFDSILNPCAQGAGNYNLTLTLETKGCPPVVVNNVLLDIVKLPYAGENATDTFCINAGTINVLNILTGSNGPPTPGGVLSSTPEYLGTSKTGGTFTTGNPPAFDGTGTFVLTYTVGTAGCPGTVQADATIVVKDNPDVGQNSTVNMCEGTLLDLRTVLPNIDKSGTFTQCSGSPNGIAANTPYNTAIFAPSAPGTYTVCYTVNNGYCPAATSTTTIVVNPRPNAGIDVDTIYCGSTTSINLTDLLNGASSTLGEFRGANTANVVGSTYYPSLDIADTCYNINYVVTGAGCPNDTANITICLEKVPQAGTDATINVCVDEDPFNMTLELGGFVDDSGVWRAKNGDNDDFLNTGNPNRKIFNPVLFGGGTHEIVYTVKGIKCPSDSATLTINVIDKPKSGVKDTTVVLCADPDNDVIYKLSNALGVQTVDYDLGGNWTDKNGFDALELQSTNQLGAGTHKFKYTVLAPPCAPSSTFVTLVINAKPQAGPDRDTVLCVGGPVFDLNTAILPPGTSGGTWKEASGSLTFTDGSTVYSPRVDEAGVLDYHKSVEGCPNDTAHVKIKVNKAPTPFADPKDTICLSDVPFNLNIYTTGLTGTWSVNPSLSPDNNRAIPALQSPNFFSNQAGKGHYVLTFSDDTLGCPASKSTLTLDVVGPGNDTIIDACVSNTQINLSNLCMAQDIPGTWVGSSAISGNIFNPNAAGVGTYTISLSGAGAPANCKAEAVISVRPKLTIGNSFKLTCDIGTKTYRVEFTIDGATTPYSVNGTVLSGKNFVSAPIPFGSAFSFNVTSPAACNDTLISGSTDCGDFDADNIPDIVDRDDDNDGLPDVLEAGENIADAHGDHNGNGNPNYRDAGYCATVGGTMVKGVCSKYDSDADGVINQYDYDSDADGISDLIEGFDFITGNIYDGNQVDGKIDPISETAAKDGWHDNAASRLGNATNYLAAFNAVEQTKNGVADYLNLDSDSDGIGDCVEGGGSIYVIPGDADNDKLPDFRSTDSDNDSISDTYEAGLNRSGICDPVPDFDDDGKKDYADNDADNDGMLDFVDARVDSAGVVPQDFDSDGFANHIDIDSDGDNILDSVEAGPDKMKPRTTTLLPDTIADYLNRDSDGDDICDYYEGHTRKGLVSLYDAVVDTDEDGVMDYLDLNSDGDSIMDAEEGRGACDPSYADETGPYDSDEDGIYDFRETDSDGDGLSDNYEARKDYILLSANDFDGDGTPDHRDRDSDDDCIPDAIEARYDFYSFANTDSAYTWLLDARNVDPKDYPGALPDFHSLDSDGDGISDAIEAGPNCSSPRDSDGDKTPDFRDRDSDGDGVADSVEGSGDCDNDGIPNFADADGNCDILTFVPDGFSPNGDGVNDAFVIPAIQDFPKGDLKVFNRWGGVVFESANYQNNWDGTYNGEPLPNGTYFFVLDLGINSDKPQKGYIYINR